MHQLMSRFLKAKLVRFSGSVNQKKMLDASVVAYNSEEGGHGGSLPTEGCCFQQAVPSNGVTVLHRSPVIKKKNRKGSFFYLCSQFIHHYISYLSIQFGSYSFPVKRSLDNSHVSPTGSSGKRVQDLEASTIQAVKIFVFSLWKEWWFTHHKYLIDEQISEANKVQQYTLAITRLSR